MPKCGKMQAEQFFLRTNAAKDECKKKSTNITHTTSVLSPASKSKKKPANALQEGTPETSRGSK